MSVSVQARKISGQMSSNMKKISKRSTYSRNELFSWGGPRASIASMPIRGAAGGRLSLANSSPSGSSNSLISKYQLYYSSIRTIRTYKNANLEVSPADYNPARVPRKQGHHLMS